MDAVETEGKATGSSLDIVDVSEFGLTPTNNLICKPLDSQ